MIQKAMTKDFAPKVISLILALIVWVQVFNDKNPLERRVFALEVVPNQIEDEAVIVSANPQKVNVTFEGRARTLDEIDKDSLKAVADLPEGEAGTFSADVIVDAPYGVKVIEINPKTVTVEVDIMFSSDVGLAIEAQGVPHEDFEAGEPIPSVGTINVQGPKKLVEQVKYAQGTVDISGAADDKHTAAKLSARDSAGSEVLGVQLEPNEVEVTVPLNPLPPSKILPVQAVVTGVPRPGFAVGPVVVNPVQVKVRADQKVLDSLSWIATKPIDVSGKDSDFMRQTGFDVPKGVTVQEAHALVTVEIVEDIETETFDGVIVQLESPPVGYAWEIDPATVSVVVTGRSDILSKVSKDDITVYIDAQGRTEGTTDLVVAYRIQAPDGVKADDIQVDIRPPRVKLTLTKR